jgi:hypothetical protein
MQSLNRNAEGSCRTRTPTKGTDSDGFRSVNSNNTPGEQSSPRMALTATPRAVTPPGEERPPSRSALTSSARVSPTRVVIPSEVAPSANAASYFHPKVVTQAKANPFATSCGAANQVKPNPFAAAAQSSKSFIPPGGAAAARTLTPSRVQAPADMSTSPGPGFHKEAVKGKLKLDVNLVVSKEVKALLEFAGEEGLDVINFPGYQSLVKKAISNRGDWYMTDDEFQIYTVIADNLFGK